MTALIIAAAVALVILAGLLIDLDRRRRREMTPPRIHDDRDGWSRFRHAINKEKSNR